MINYNSKREDLEEEDQRQDERILASDSLQNAFINPGTWIHISKNLGNER